MVLGTEDGSNSLHGGDRPGVILESLLIARNGTVEVLKLLRQRSYKTLADAR
jgi:hypothetical protein